MNTKLQNKKSNKLFKTSALWQKTAKSTLLADKAATVAITIVGLGSIVTLFGILFFLIQTVWPLLKSERLEFETSAQPASLDHRIYVDDEYPFALAQQSDVNGCEFAIIDTSTGQNLKKIFYTSEGFSEEPNDRDLQTTCISQRDESLLFRTQDEYSIFRISFRSEPISQQERSGLPQEFFKTLAQKKFNLIDKTIYTQSGTNSAPSRWTPQADLLKKFTKDELTQQDWIRKSLDAGTLSTQKISDAKYLIFAKPLGDIEHAALLVQNTNEFTGEQVSLTRDVSWPSEEALLSIFLFNDTELFALTKSNSILRASLDDLQEQPLFLKKSSSINAPSPIYFAKKIWGADSIFMVSGTVCSLLDAGKFIRDPDSTKKQLQPLWSIPCPKNIKFVLPHPHERAVILLTDSHFLGFETTTHRKLFEHSLPDILTVPLDSIQDIRFSNGGQFLKIYHNDKADIVRFSAPHIDASFSSFFKSIQYEGYEKKEYVWQSTSGAEDFQPKYSLVPLIWGTLKATFYAILFAGPVGIFAAIYSSEFLDRNTRNIIKPTVELMASIPSVVLGFLAAIVIAPWVEQHVVSVILAGLTTPFLMFLLGNILSNLSAKYISRRGLYASRLLIFWLVVGCLLCFLTTSQIGLVIEKTAFGGDIKTFLSGGPGSESALWGILLLPLVLIALWSLPIRQHTKAFKFFAFCVAPFLSLGIGFLLSAEQTLRNSGIASYAQRNTLVIAIAMGFAIIPIIYSIAEDALSAVPPTLRAGSLACGASVWQTTSRIVVPTAASGIFSALMIGIGRAVGETMIVVMATGNTPVMGVNPFEGLRSLAANIAVELPEAPLGGTHYRTLFFSALLLFFFTFLLNSVAEYLRYRIRRRIRAL